VLRARIVLLAAREVGECGDRGPLRYQPSGSSPPAQAFRRTAVERPGRPPRNGPAPGLSPLGKRRDQGHGVRIAGDHQRAAVALELHRAGQGADRQRSRGLHLGRRGMAKVRSEAVRPWSHRSWFFSRHPPFALKAAWSWISRPDLPGTAAGKTGVPDQLGRKDQYPGSPPLPPHSGAR
jgi:hypothetical protein